MKRLKLRCKPLDNLLQGGIENQSLTEIYGAAGTGKTNICLQFSRECALKGKKIAYIDSEGVSIERFEQICSNYDFKKILRNILFFNPMSLEEQEKMIEKAIKLQNLGLIILDTFNMYYRVKLEEDEKLANRSLNRQIINLQLASRNKNIYVLIAGQVYTIENDDVKPFAGRGIEHIAKTIIKIEKTGIGKRLATIIKHRSITEEKKAFFTITSNGLE
jgi:DNA repair protein RadB